MATTLAAIFFLLWASAALSQTAQVTHNSNLRKAASSSSPRLESISAGSQVTLLSSRQRSGYYHVQAEDGQKGWLLAKNVSVGMGQGGSETQPSSSTTTTSSAGGFSPGCSLPFASIAVKHPITDDSCTIDGTKRGGGALSDAKLAENHVKNNFCLTDTPVDIAYSDLLQLQQERQDVHDAQLPDAATRKSQLANVIEVNGHKVGEGTLVRLVIDVISAHYSDTQQHPSQNSFGESVNCYRPSNEENDIHIILGESPSADECSSVTAEMSPHFRPAKWTPDAVKSVGEHPIRVTGQIFYDSSHTVCVNGKGSPKRASLWEIHPVYAFEVCSLTDVEACKSGPDSNWTPLDQFVP